MQPSPAQRRTILALTFATGAAGLVYQVVWQRYLARLLGSDGLATATVLAVFLAGLALGYRAWGRRSLRSGGLLRTYGWLECGIGLWALVFPYWFGLIDRWTSAWALEPPWGLALGGALSALLLIGPPTFCMGGTVPILTRVLTVLLERATRTHALVYAVNTAGAVAGALATGYVLIHRLGLPGSLRLAASFNLLAGVWFLWIGRVEPRRSGRGAAPPDAPDAAATGWRLCAIAGLSGFYFMTFETIWIRFVQLSVGASSFNFSLVVAAVILGVAVGAWVAGRVARGRSGALFRNQVAALISLAMLFWTLDTWPWAAYALRREFASSDSGFVLFNIALFATLFAVLGIPAGLMGATLPLTFDAAGKTLRSVGRQAGALLGWNALGSLLGGLIGGYLLLSRFNLGEAYLVALGMVAVSAWLAGAPYSRGRRIVALVASAAALAVALWFPYDPLRFAIGTFRLRQPIPLESRGAAAFYENYYRNRSVLAYRDDPDGTFAVVENLLPEQLLTREFPELAARLYETVLPRQSDALPRSIVVNGKSDSSTHYDRETLRLSAHLPALFGVLPERVLVIGLGTGVTAGELTLYPETKQIRVAEISTAVGDFLPFFDSAIHGLREDPRYELVTGDAFRVLRRLSGRYDVIVSEPSNPWVLGVAQLFSREFYAQVGERLEAEGVLVQWIQRYATTDEVYATIVRTLRNEFMHVRVFRGAEHDDLLIASKAPLGADRLTGIARLLGSHAEVRRSLAEIDVLGLDDLLLRELQLPPDTGTGALETLDRPRIHHLSGRAFFKAETLEQPLPVR